MPEQINLVPPISDVSSIIPIMSLFTHDGICHGQACCIAVNADRICAGFTMLRSLSGLVLSPNPSANHETLTLRLDKLAGAENGKVSEGAGSAVIGDKHGPRTQAAMPRPLASFSGAGELNYWLEGSCQMQRCGSVAIGLSGHFPTTRNTKIRVPPARPVHADCSIFSDLQVWRSMNGLP
ncbi:hypothetical protein BO83DRAFT_401721 [Aspergillus eucalypticola CBS 122712]|uniref:Uncharacterized protein n=1 Tax=Aspergillus eucalypticola (strain CBS 122712 / IBT 29274) TaxID=1448314 RepID=A0A317UVW9_ASPEC|nr:uncharacterized protein BO83DRAFT_401721 [Aspergillus eucalypticola CBS 122712]PWY65785.1 hypothetical protein BO83DRAFT_401721 [Aspergillus eucalypticola CBS 122712]